ncbi:small ribosomal subunit protein mS31 [Cloeon dipterum]|uniref:small ribosomal subunit protein mS31 n=1 Tax=Cloeon dipterum TaxID=197152 RepID=UPI00321F7D41
MQSITSARLCNQFRSMCRFPGRNRSQIVRYFSDDDSQKNKEAEVKVKKDTPIEEKSEQKASAALKLSNLLQAIIQDDLTMKSEKENLKLSTAKNKKGSFKKVVTAAEYQLGKEMADAIVGVSKELEGDKEQIKADLIDKVASMKAPVAEHILEAPVKEQDAAPKEPVNFSDLIGGMTVEKIAKARPQVKTDTQYSRAGRVRGNIKDKVDDEPILSSRRRRFAPDEPSVRAGLEESVPLGIFSDPASLRKAEPLLPIWEQMHQRDLQLAVMYPPSNIYEEMISWTNQGKLWKFPIDNEQGWEREQNVPFSEHIFLDKHLQDWCPKKGPVRHFMELVCIGLSKNPHFTVEEKKEHILGYKNYFAGKSQLLKELGAV